MIVIDKTSKFGITWEVIEKVDDFFYGSINFIIDGEMFLHLVLLIIKLKRFFGI